MQAATMATNTQSLNEDACYAALTQRRASSDGLFFVAVTTTKIYCRPVCPSRTPMRKNVRFYTSPDDAERAGFRACKRCLPREPARAEVTLIKKICRLLDTADVPPRLADLSVQCSVSPFHLQRTFKRITGLTPRQYAETRRIERLKSSLRAGNGVSAAVYGAGYRSSSRAYDGAAGALGMTPGTYGRGGAGMSIAYTITPCRYGLMLVAATERGISAISFGDREMPLEDALRAEYPHAQIDRDNTAMRRWVNEVLRAVDRNTDQPQLPLDIQATAFRRRVWDALRTIPRGETRTYAQIARQIGSPKAARAVGSACRTNPVSYIVPCHRVVREDGGLGGYAYGLDRKKKMLDREASRVSK